jgi:hypothetical protein
MRDWAVSFAFLASVVLVGASPARGNTVTALSWDHDSSGRTTVTIVCDSAIPEASFRTYTLSDPARAVIVMEDVRPPVESSELIIEDQFVRKIRLVHHPERRPNELLLVFDLESESAVILVIRHDVDRITAVLGYPESPTTLAPAASTTLSPTWVPTGVPTPIPAMEATATPEATPTTLQTETGAGTAAGLATATRTPSATATATETPSATATALETPSATATTTPTATPSTMATYPDRPAPPVLPVAPEPATATPEPPQPIRPPVDATPTPDPDPATAEKVVDVTASCRGDGSTLLRITADGRIPQGDARYLEVSGDPPRVVVTIRGLSAPDLPRSIAIDDPNIERIRLIHDAETIDGELHLVLHLTRSQISVVTMQQVGPNLVIQLTPAD